MDSLMELIDNRIEKALAKSSCVNSQLGVVNEIDGEIYKVKLVATGAIYNLRNYSGSDIKVGQTVHVYWRGGFCSNQNAYIGATLSRYNNLTYIIGNKSTGALSQTDKTVMSFAFEAYEKTTATLVFNAQIESSDSGNIIFTIINGENTLSYTPTQTVGSGYAHCSFTLPLTILDAGSQTVVVKAKGVGSITEIESYIYGQGIGE